MATLVLTERTVRRYADNLQIALPLLAWGCSATAGGGKEFAKRFFAMLAVAHRSKALLGAAPLNQHPSGGEEGFPSAHTAAAALGASALVNSCLRESPVPLSVVLVSSAFVGGSWIEVGAHSIWQVRAGGLLGWGADRVLRRQGHGSDRPSLPFPRRKNSWARRPDGRPASCRTACSRHCPRRGRDFGLRQLPDIAARHDQHSILGNDRVKWEGKAPSRCRPTGASARRCGKINARFGYGLDLNHAKV